ncbi:MAG: response regulator transcription factor, partial [Spirochaetaceae bacterium]
KGLAQVGYAVDAVGAADAAIASLQTTSYDVAVVDLMLPGMQGTELISELRRRENPIPILILSAKQSVDDRVEGLRAGADDYMVKPFAFTELVERLRALQRRVGTGAPQRTLSAGDLVLDTHDRTVTRGTRTVELRPREFALLELLMNNKGRTVPKAVILERVWNFDFDPQTNVVDVLVHRLRKRIEHPGETQLIQTVRGVGYRIEAQAEEA